VLAWTLLVPLGLLAFVAAWAGAIDAASPRTRPKVPRWLAHPAGDGALGLLVPGLGLAIAGRGDRAGRAFWIVGPAATAAVVVAHWGWLLERSRVSSAPGLSAAHLEILLLVAIGVLFVAVLAWISQALDGARLASTGRDGSRADASGVALLVALIGLGLGFRPEAAAACLHRAAGPLETQGLRVIPLLLWETAARIDPVRATYVVRAAQLDDAIGRSDAAASKRRALALRAADYAGATGRQEVEARPIVAAPLPQVW
jgi:hypothetical protein